VSVMWVDASGAGTPDGLDAAGASSRPGCACLGRGPACRADAL